MVKSIIYTATALVLCVTLFIFCELYLHAQFDELYKVSDSIYAKIEDKSVTEDDAYALKSLWEEKKQTLHIIIPHNDVSSFELAINELCGYISAKNYELALGKAEALRGAAQALPNSYSIRIENIL